MAGINLRGRVPVVLSTISARLIWTAVAVLVLLGGSIVWGFHYRIEQQEQRKKVTLENVAAADAAQSNRQEVRGGEVSPSSLTTPAVTPRTDFSPIIQPVVDAVHTVAQPFGSSQKQPQTTPYYPPAPTIAPYDPGQRPAAADSLKDQQLAHQYERRLAALEAPTGAVKTGSTSSVQNTQDPYQAEMARINAMAGQPGASAASRNDVVADGPNEQVQKRKFLEESGPTDEYLKAARVPPASRWIVEKGDVIPAAMSFKVVSDLPGDIIAQVKRDVYDTPTHQYVMIPAGSLLAGEYNSSLTYGQNRVQVVWTYLRFPDGSHMYLERFPGLSADGSAGLKDQVDNHYKRLIGGVALSSLFAAGIQISQNRTNGGTNGVLTYPSNGQIAGAAVAQQAATLGQEITSRNLGIQPTGKIRPGDPIAVDVKKTILFDGPYEAMKF